MSNENEINKEPQNKIWIIGPMAGDARATRSITRRDVVEKPVEVLQVRNHFHHFLQSLEAIVDVDVPAVGQFELDEVQFSAEISANGEFKLLGTGAGVQASSGVTFTLRRKVQPPAGAAS
jgi:hypothetical protein